MFCPYKKTAVSPFYIFPAVHRTRNTTGFCKNCTRSIHRLRMITTKRLAFMSVSPSRYHYRVESLLHLLCAFRGPRCTPFLVEIGFEIQLSYAKIGLNLFLSIIIMINYHPTSRIRADLTSLFEIKPCTKGL